MQRLLSHARMALWCAVITASSGCEARSPDAAATADGAGTGEGSGAIDPSQSDSPTVSLALSGAASVSTAAAAPEPAFLSLDVPGYPSAMVSMPRAGGPWPVVVATHGNFDRPEWQCEIQRGIAGDGFFVLCPRGLARPDSPSATDMRFTYAQNEKLEAETFAGLGALRARFGERVAAGPAIYMGFSLGAIMGVAILARGARPGAFDRAVLIEGGYDRITADKAKKLAEHGVARVLIACGQPGCLTTGAAAAKLLQRVGIEARVVGSKTAGHTYDGPVAEAIRGEWSWLAGPVSSGG